MKIEVSNGEIVDKHTILKIKAKYIKDKAKLINVLNELVELEMAIAEIPFKGSDYDALHSVNEQLWLVEDRLREYERIGKFSREFVNLARSVYKLNDQRYEIKRRINEESGSELKEEKSYSS